MKKNNNNTFCPKRIRLLISNEIMRRRYLYNWNVIRTTHSCARVRIYNRKRDRSLVHKKMTQFKALYFSSQIRVSEHLKDSLTNKMAYKYNHSKHIPFNLYVDISDVLDENYDWETVKETLEYGNTYLVTIKLFYKTNDNTYDYKTCGEQLLFTYNSIDGLDKKLSVVVKRVQSILDQYTLDMDQVEYVHLVTNRLKSEFLTDIKINKDTLNKKDRKFYDKVITKLPLTIDSDVLGIPLNTVLNNDNTINSIFVDINGYTYNFLEKISEINSLRGKVGKNPIVFDNNYKFYLRGSSEKNYSILAVKLLEDESILKEVYDFHTGDLIVSSIDRLVFEDVIRTIGNKEITISRKENLVEFEKQLLNLSTIDRKEFLTKRKFTLGGEKTRFGVFDLETYIKYNNSSGEQIDKQALVYAAGLYVKDIINEVFYIEPNMNSHTLVIKMLETMFKHEFEGYSWYCHNFAKYDSFFIIGAVSWHNDQQLLEEDKYKMYPITRDGYPIKLTISKKFNNSVKRINLVDSLPILPSSLRDLAESFGVEHQKGYFPHSFVEENKLYYVGNIPARSHFGSIGYDEYELISNRNQWSLKHEAIEYCKYDNMALYDILSVANKRFYLDYNIQMTSSLTISKMALELYLVEHYKNNIPLINNKTLYNDLKKAYYGGCTEVYKPYGENLFYYDVNSLYPYVALNDMPGKECIYINSPNTGMNLNNLFGFFYCEIEANNRYLGLLPHRSKQGLIFPIGKWSGWYFSEELKYAQNNGYKIKVIKGYNFSREKDVFKSYINTLYEKKVNAKDSVMKNITKLLLNSLLGRFGLNIFKDQTEIMSTSVYNKMSLVVSVKHDRDIGKDNKYVTFTPGINIERCKENSIDIIKVKNKFYNLPGVSEGENLHKQVSIAISAAINSYARIYMANIKKFVLDSKGEIYYSDTDSLVTDMELPEELVSPSEIGKFKLENKISKGYFISSKTYGILLNEKDKNGNPIFISRAKGVTEKLSIQQYEMLYTGTDQKNISRTSSIKQWEAWSVIIHEVPVTVHYDAYKRRQKIYKNGLWVDTKPLCIGENSDSGFTIIKPEEEKNNIVFVGDIKDDNKQKFHVNDLDRSIIVYKNRFSLIEYANPHNYNSIVYRSFLMKGGKYIHSSKKISMINVKDLQSFKWWYWGIFPIAVVGYIISYSLTEEENAATKYYLPLEEHLYIENNISELESEFNNEVELPHNDLVKNDDGLWEWYKLFMDKLFGKEFVDFKPKNIDISIRVENTIHEDLVSRGSIIIESEGINLAEYDDKLMEDCINEVIKKEKFETFDALIEFVNSSINNNKYPSDCKDNLIKNMQERVYDLEIMSLLVKEETHRIVDLPNRSSSLGSNIFINESSNNTIPSSNNSPISESVESSSYLQRLQGWLTDTWNGVGYLRVIKESSETSPVKEPKWFELLHKQGIILPKEVQEYDENDTSDLYEGVKFHDKTSYDEDKALTQKIQDMEAITEKAKKNFSELYGQNINPTTNTIPEQSTSIEEIVVSKPDYKDSELTSGYPKGLSFKAQGKRPVYEIDGNNENEDEIEKHLINKGITAQEFEKRLEIWDHKEEEVQKEKVLKEERRVRANHKIEMLKKDILRRQYLEALEEEDNKSPCSWNLKTRSKIFGHEFALKYFNSEDYKLRKGHLDNRTEIEKDIQKSRHYRESLDLDKSVASESDDNNEENS